MRWYIEVDGKPVICDDVQTWAQWMTDFNKNRQVANTVIGSVRVSTVFLGFDHSWAFGLHEPVLYETMVFGGPLDGEQDRYTSRADAVAGHEAMMARVKQARP